eukprot:Hpha_TRINITY_DN7784_c0_g1::TRINITY_DN7784_c0_g1_i1::g.85426::m.85426/K00432/gpx; glutathione peroxidase
MRWLRYAGLAACGAGVALARGNRLPAAASEGCFYDIVEGGADGQEISFERFRGRVVYGVNVASRCACTASEYALLRAVHEQHGDSVALVVFPCAQFAKQEFADNDRILEFAREHGPPGLVVCGLGDVKGKNPRPTYAFLSQTFPGMKVAWNFRGKFLVSKTGRVALTNDPLADLPSLVAE